jgi:ABC-type multidrug transport system ATPase subunit
MQIIRTIIITIHDIDVALKVCDRVAIIKEGHLAAQFNNPKDKTVKAKALRLMQSAVLKENVNNEN